MSPCAQEEQTPFRNSTVALWPEFGYAPFRSCRNSFFGRYGRWRFLRTEKGGLPSVARSPEAIAHLRVARTQRDATVGILRVNHERRMVDLTGIEPVTS